MTFRCRGGSFLFVIFLSAAVESSVSPFGTFFNNIINNGISLLNNPFAACVFGPINTRFHICTRDDRNCTVRTLNDEYLCSNYPTDRYVYLIHGFASSADKPNWLDIKDATLNSVNAIVVLLQWEDAACYDPNVEIDPPLYPFALKNIPQVTETLFKFMRRSIEECGMDLNQSKIVGNSIGAHIAGLVGKMIFQTYEQRIARITGLDPAGPGFLHLPSKERLESSDATFVDVIHTNDLLCGFPESIGHADFYIFGGKCQPQCHCEAFCSHKRSVEIYKEDLRANGTIIVGIPWDHKLNDAPTPKCGQEWEYCPLESEYFQSECKGDFYVGTLPLDHCK